MTFCASGRFLRFIFLSAIWSFLALAQEAWISEISPEELFFEGTRAEPVGDGKTLLKIGRSSDAFSFPSLLINLPQNSRDLSRRRFIEATFRNIGEAEIDLAFWAVGAPGWDAPVDSASLSPGESRLFSIDLQQRWKGGLVGKIDSSEIRYLRVSLGKNSSGAALEMSPISLRGKTSETASAPPDFQRLDVPDMTAESPAAGRRVRDQLPQFQNTELYHALYLPTDWKPGKRYPIIVEYAGNRWLSPPCHSIGSPEGSRMGYGMSEGKGYIWVNAPFVDFSGKTQALNGWGDPDATARYAIDLVNHVSANYRGDPSAVILTGFSRGAVACGYIGLRDDRVADVWLAFHSCQHFDGDGYGGASFETALAERGPRIKGRPTFHTDNGDEKDLRILFEKLAFPVTYASSDLGAHTDTMFLENRPSTVKLREWLAETVAKKPGTMTISGKVVDKNGKGIGGVLLQSGPTHFTHTRPDGSYSLEGLVIGKREITASHESWKAVHQLDPAEKNLSAIDFQKD
ncbi:hypothetical protein ACFSSA_00405 [Luteolibacter algae]|uniref:Uncharacterized protein n=1 Tax=Luteolibacter algae TaxID=454151 RepID=A0ABW5D4C3_9BACT